MKFYQKRISQYALVCFLYHFFCLSCLDYLHFLSCKASQTNSKNYQVCIQRAFFDDTPFYLSLSVYLLVRPKHMQINQLYQCTVFDTRSLDNMLIKRGVFKCAISTISHLATIKYGLFYQYINVILVPKLCRQRNGLGKQKTMHRLENSL